MLHFTTYNYRLTSIDVETVPDIYRNEIDESIIFKIDSAYGAEAR